MVGVSWWVERKGRNVVGHVKEGLRRPKKSNNLERRGGICLGNNVEWVKGVFYVSLEMHMNLGSSVRFYRYRTYGA
jgi:hypothetical protein